MEIKELKNEINEVLWGSVKESLIDTEEENGLAEAWFSIRNEINCCDSLTDFIKVMVDWGWDKEDALEVINDTFLME
jgi:hypothetical protein